jgi:hypothetical protein
VQVECQVEVRRAQAFAAFCNAGNAMLSSKRKLFAELGRVAAKFSLTDRLTASRCWVNARGRAENSSVESTDVLEAWMRHGKDLRQVCRFSQATWASEVFVNLAKVTSSHSEWCVGGQNPPMSCPGLPDPAAAACDLHSQLTRFQRMEITSRRLKSPNRLPYALTQATITVYLEASTALRRLRR